MTYRVLYTDTFIQDLNRQIEYLRGEEVASPTIERWFSRLYELVDSLDEWPYHYPVDPIQTEATGRETRKVNLGDYLVFYQVDDENRQVNVVAFVHGARRRES